MAGIERPTEDGSVYEVSNQISEKLENVVVKRLAVKRKRISTARVKPGLRCAKLCGKAEVLFSMIEDSSVDLPEFQNYLDANVVSMDAQNEFCEVPILASLRARKIDFFKYLYNRMGQPDLNRKWDSSQHSSVFEYALGFSSVEIIEYIRSLGGDLGKKDNILSWVAEYNTVDVVQYYMRKYPELINKWDDAYLYPLMRAAQHNSLDVVKVLVGAGADVNAILAFERNMGGVMVKGDSALWFAARFNSVDVVEFLLASGARGGQSALVQAGYRSWEIVKLFLDAGLDVNKQDEHGQSVLYTATRRPFDKESEAVILGLIKAGADVNQSTPANSQTALMNAAEKGSTSLIKLLLKAGANKNAENFARRTAFDIASKNGHRNAESVLFYAR
ncbi:MAG: ankyrin repeat domain-containing protein [Bdellovibrionaceae bacterium]|nr:ankyrin repeat domain-containing protein [Pseudobdellovibrionaceae bacterium]